MSVSSKELLALAEVARLFLNPDKRTRALLDEAAGYAKTVQDSVHTKHSLAELEHMNKKAAESEAAARNTLRDAKRIKRDAEEEASKRLSDAAEQINRDNNEFVQRVRAHDKRVEDFEADMQKRGAEANKREKAVAQREAAVDTREERVEARESSVAATLGKLESAGIALVN